jgi:predicted acyl esterase
MKYFCFVTVMILFSGISEAQVLTPVVDSIPMRDTKKLAADIYLPDGGTTARPTILIQTPYNRLYYRFGLPLNVGLGLAGSDYNFVILDWRGFYGSASAIIAQPKRGEDGYDAVEWIAQQPWSDGQVATWGPSALGKIQFQTAKENPPHLVCCVPLVAGSQFDYDEYYPGGVAREEYIEQLDNLGYGLSTFLYAHPFYDIVWQYSETQNYYPSQIQVPCFMIGGWYDHNVEVMLELFAGIRQSSPLAVRNSHRLLMGPWAHGGFGAAQVGTCNQGELVFNEACDWSDSLALRFLDYYLLNETNGWDQQPYVMYFQLGENQWYDVPAWPPVLSAGNIFLQPSGVLSFTGPLTGGGASSFMYDPSDPSPTIGGSTLRQDLLQGPYDQAPVVESRSDILVFSTSVLSEPVRFAGKPLVHLNVSTDRKDTDFAVRLCDVYPDGRSMIVSDGILRLRFRDGFSVSDTASAVPGQVYAIDISLPNTAITFMPGHKIRLDITSSNYPRFNNNMNNGSVQYVTGDTLIASNQVFHSNIYPSYIQVPYEIMTGMSVAEMEPEWSVGPDPVQDIVKVTVEGDLLFDMKFITQTGQVIADQHKISGSATVDCSSWTPGIYYCYISVEGKEFCRKICKI